MNALLLSLSLALASGDVAPSTAAAPAVEDGLSVGRDEGVIALGVGIGLGVASALAFQAGNEQERRLRAGEATGEAADEALFRRGVAAWVAWPTAVLAVASVGASAFILGSAELAAREGQLAAREGQLGVEEGE